MLRTDAALRKAAPIVEAIATLELTWLEAGVFLHGYLRGLDWPDVAETLDLPMEQIEAARWSLVTKVRDAMKRASAGGVKVA